MKTEGGIALLLIAALMALSALVYRQDAERALRCAEACEEIGYQGAIVRGRCVCGEYKEMR